jgi:putative membrane protein
MTAKDYINHYKLEISIITVWLFHTSAIIGILSGYQDWFLPLTPLNMLLCLGLILWNIPNVRAKDVALLGVPFMLGMIAEILGVNYGLIFGNYAYGSNLGWKVLGVPLTIGVNWTILVFITASIAQKWTKNLFIGAALASGLMVLLDLLIEVVAPEFDFWEFESGEVPFQNYVGWFVVAFIAQLVHLKFFKKHQVKLSIGIFWAFAVFFGIFGR